jgi:hypothetical protein
MEVTELKLLLSVTSPAGFTLELYLDDRNESAFLRYSNELDEVLQGTCYLDVSTEERYLEAIAHFLYCCKQYLGVTVELPIAEYTY